MQQAEQKEWEFELGKGILQFVSTTFTNFSKGWPNLLCHKSYNEQEWDRIDTCKARTDGAGIVTFEEDNRGYNYLLRLIWVWSKTYNPFLSFPSNSTVLEV